MAEGNRTGAEMDEEELASRMLQVQSKRFYLDVKQNRRGRFIKIAEVGSGGHKSRILMSIVAANDFKNRLGSMDAFYKELEPQRIGQNEASNGTGANNLLRSDVMHYHNRRYYLDLKENSRGKFLRVTQIVIKAASLRSQVAIPAQGMEKLKETLEELLNAYGKVTEQTRILSSLPESTRIRADNKVFFCDVRQNNRGIFMRISEVQRDYRSVISVPQESWIQFRDYFMDVCDEMARMNCAAGNEDGGDDDDDGGGAVGGGGSDHAGSGSSTDSADLIKVGDRS